MSDGDRPTVREARSGEITVLTELRGALWPDGSAKEHRRELEAFFDGRGREPLAVLVAESRDGDVTGFAEVSIHPYAEGCRTDRVGYLEGWYVRPGHRGRGLGRALVEAAEDWARARGCTEFASDAAVDDEASRAAHRAVGFSEAGIVRCFRKDL